MRLQVKIYLITILALILVVFLNEFNLRELNGMSPFDSKMISTADEASYFAPAVNFLDRGEWKDNGEGPSSYFTRTPAYGMIFLLCKLIAGNSAFTLLKIIQILLFGGSIILLAKLLEFLKLKENYLLIVLSAYAFLPAFSGFVYYTLSESIIPFFFLLWILSVIKAKEDQFISWNVILSGSMLIMIRPQLMIFPLILLAFQILKRKRIAVSVILAFTPLFLWNIRTYSIAGEWLGLHPIYSSKNMSMYRPPHKELTELFKVWEFDSERFHNVTGILASDTSELSLERAVALVPEKFQNDCRTLFASYQGIYFKQNHGLKEKAKLGLIEGEEKLCLDIQSTKNKLIAENPMDYYLKTPAKSFIKLFKTSMMNLFVFQETWKDSYMIRFLKLISFTILVGGFFSSLVLIFSKVNIHIKVLSIAVLCSVFYLVYIQRLNEERYIAPFLFLLLVNLALTVKLILDKIKMITQRMTINQKI